MDGSRRWAGIPCCRRRLPAIVAAVVIASLGVLGSGVGAVSARTHASTGARPANIVPVGVSLSPTTLNFGNQAVGSPTTQTITLINTGVVSAVISANSLSVTGANAADFSATTSCPAILPVHTNCSIDVVFKPSASGVRTASVSIGVAGTVLAATLNGNGVLPSLSVSPASLTFGNQAVGTRSATQSVTLTNIGLAPLTIAGITLGGANPMDVAITSHCPATLGGAVAGQANSCRIDVTFAPTATGARAATLIITDNAANSPQSVTLTGMGLGPAAELSATSLSFPDQPQGTVSSAAVVTVTNTGTSPLAVSGIGLAGANPGDFAASGTCAGAALPPSSACAVDVTFAPAATGTRTATLLITDTVTSSPLSVALSGSGINPVPGFVPSTVTFADQAVGTRSAGRTVYLANFGTTPLTISRVAVTGANPGDFGESDACAGATLAPRGTCAITVTFAPTAAGVRSAILGVTDNAATSPNTLALSGAGIFAPATATAVPAPTAAAPPPRSPTPPVALSLSPGTIVAGGYLTISAHTPSRARVTIALRVFATRTITSGARRGRKQSVVVYRIVLKGTADARGRFSRRVRVAYRPAMPVPAGVTLEATSGRKTLLSAATVTIQAIPLSISVRPGHVASGGTLTLSARTVGRARIDALFQVTQTQVYFSTSGGRRTKSVSVTVLYQVALHGTADRKGRFTGHLRAVVPVDAMGGLLTVTARAPAGAARAATAVRVVPPLG